MPTNPKINTLNVNGDTYDLEDSSAVKTVTVNSVTYSPTSGDVDLGTIGGGGTVIYDGDSTTDTPYDNLFMDTVASGVESLIVGGITISEPPLWENSATTTNYGAGTATFDSTGYEALFLIYVGATGSGYNNIYVSMPLVKKDINYLCTSMIGSRLRLRYSKWTTSGVVFTECNRYQTYGGSADTDNSCLIPYRVYGIRSAIAVSGQAKMEAIWTNPNPTNSFSSTTITPTDFGNYARGAVLFGYDTSNSPQCLVDFTKGGTFICNMFNSNSSRVFRTFTVSDSTITFGGGTSAGGDNNGASIPLVVYGIR